MASVIAGNYEIQDQIGTGGGRIVYMGRHMRLDKKIVLKADRRKLGTKPEILRREVDMLKDLSHTYIPQVYDFVQEDGTEGADGLSPASPPTGNTGSTGRGGGFLLDVRSDIYSLGATLYHLISGKRPAQDAKEVEPLGPEVCRSQGSFRRPWPWRCTSGRQSCFIRRPGRRLPCCRLWIRPFPRKCLWITPNWSMPATRG
ncbi:MAG: hypothetical protein HFG75_13425 [Hungatella sp.]|nr:hypothetical protein [Hungatella sp.]